VPETLLDRILEPRGLNVVFQPILEYNKGEWRLHAFEALVRGLRGTHLESPEVLFEYVRRKGAEREVDRRCIAEILRGSGPLGRSALLSVNVHAATLEQDVGFPQFLDEQVQQHRLTPSRMIVEIVEHAPSWSGHRFAHALNVLREIGFNIALDDVGLGQSNFRMILECRPDYFKVDRFLVAGSHADYYRRAVIRSIVDLAASFGGTAVAEGIDNTDDLETVVSEGFRKVQGHLLARPAAAAVLGHGDFVNSIVQGFPSVPSDSAEWAPDTDWLSVVSRRLTQPAEKVAV